MTSDYSTPLEKIVRIALGIFCLCVLVFLTAPILVIIPLSFNSSSFLTFPMDGFSLRWYSGLMQSQAWHLAIANTLIITPGATLLATVLGTVAAIGLSKSDSRYKAIITGIIISPMIVPLVIVAVGLFFFYAKIRLLNSYTGLIIAHAILGVPFVIITVTATLQGFDQNLRMAAASLGASPLTSFFKVVLPLIAPGVISGALFAFATSFDEVVVTLFLAGPTQTTIPLAMFSGIRENISPEIAAVATLMICLAIFLLLTLEMLRRRAAKLRVSVQ